MEQEKAKSQSLKAQLKPKATRSNFSDILLAVATPGGVGNEINDSEGIC